MEPNGQLYGYARVSATDQNTTMQIEALRNRGCTTIVEERITGVAAFKPEFEKLMLKLKTGDTLVVWKIDRLGRNVILLGQLVQRLNAMGVHFVSVTESIDTTSAHGKMFFNLMATFAEFERELIRERVLTGVQNAMQNGTRSGRPFGRPRTDEQLLIQTQELIRQTGMPIRRACEQNGVGYMTFFNWKKQNKI